MTKNYSNLLKRIMSVFISFYNANSDLPINFNSLFGCVLWHISPYCQILFTHTHTLTHTHTHTHIYIYIYIYIHDLKANRL